MSAADATTTATATTKAVSYTHLDVYKRQVLVDQPGHLAGRRGGLRRERAGEGCREHGIQQGASGCERDGEPDEADRHEPPPDRQPPEPPRAGGHGAIR